MRFESSAPTCMQYKTTLQDEVAFSSVNLRRAIWGRQAVTLLPPFKPLYRETRKISKLKWKDLQSLKMFILPVHQEFYDTLACETHDAAEAHPALIKSSCEWLITVQSIAAYGFIFMFLFVHYHNALNSQGHCVKVRSEAHNYANSKPRCQYYSNKLP